MKFQVLKNFSWLVAERVIGSGALMASTIVVARYYGPEEFGAFAYALSLATLFAVAGNFGLNGLVVKECIDRPDDWRAVVSTSFWLKMTGYVIGAAFIIAISWLGPGTNQQSAWIATIIALSLLLRPFEVLDYWLQSRKNFRDPALARSGTQVVGAAFRTGFAVFAAPLKLLGVIFLVQYAALAVWYYMISSKIAARPLAIRQFSMSLARHLVAKGLPLFAGAILATVYLKIDQVMLNMVHGAAEVGIFAVAANLSEAWYFLPVSLAAVSFPDLLKAKHSGGEKYMNQMQRLTDVLFSAALLAAIMVTILSDHIILILYGDQYAAAAGVLAIHIWAGLFVFMRTAFSKWILVEGLLYFSLFTHGLGALLNVALNWFLIPKYGAVGAAYATLASYAMASYFALAPYPKSRPMFLVMTRSIFLPVRLVLNAPTLFTQMRRWLDDRRHPS